MPVTPPSYTAGKRPKWSFNVAYAILTTMEKHPGYAKWFYGLLIAAGVVIAPDVLYLLALRFNLA